MKGLFGGFYAMAYQRLLFALKITTLRQNISRESRKCGGGERKLRGWGRQSEFASLRVFQIEIRVLRINIRVAVVYADQKARRR